MHIVHHRQNVTSSLSNSHLNATECMLCILNQLHQSFTCKKATNSKFSHIQLQCLQIPYSRWCLPTLLLLAAAMISRDNTHKAFYVSEETSPNRAQTVIIFALFVIYFCSSCKPDLLPPYEICFIILHSTTTQKLVLLTSDARLFN